MKRRSRHHHGSKGIHDRGIDSLADELIKKHKYRILSVASNVLYEDHSRAPVIRGEIDLMVLYNNGTLGMYEVKSNLSKSTFHKAQKQLQRMHDVFKSYRPDMATYIAKEGVIIPYIPEKE